MYSETRVKLTPSIHVLTDIANSRPSPTLFSPSRPAATASSRLHLYMVGHSQLCRSDESIPLCQIRKSKFNCFFVAALNLHTDADAWTRECFWPVEIQFLQLCAIH